jgi:hypothetical protein
MGMSEKIKTITVQVPLKSSGGIIHQRDVAFEVIKEDGHYSLKPCLPVEERRVLNLPEFLNFTLEDGKPVSMRGSIDGNFHVIQDAVKKLQEEQDLVQ